MLERIKWVRGIGHLHDVVGGQYALEKLTLIHGGNGAGKSTLAAVLKGLSEGDDQRLFARPTLGGTQAAQVSIQTSAGVVEYDGQAWNMEFPDIHVFDSTFVNENVHSGETVEVDHRKRLLEFALGEEAAVASRAAAKAASDSSAATRAVTETRRELSGYHAGMGLDEFRDLPEQADAEGQIGALRRRQAEADRIDALRKRRVPTQVTVPDIALEQIAEVLESSLEQTHLVARQFVQDHIESLEEEGGEAWLRRGTALAHDEVCPYCGRDTTGLALVDAYRTFFDERYARHQDAVDRLPELVAGAAGQSVARTTVEALEREAVVAAAWVEDLSASSLSVPKQQLEGDFASLRELLADLVEAKRSRADEAIPRSSLDQAEQVAERIRQSVADFNQELDRIRTAAEEFVASLAGVDRASLQSEMRSLELSRVRHTDAVIGLMNQLDENERTKTKADEETVEKRDRLNALMDANLDGYLQAINSLLRKFGASFSIRSMRPDFRGGSPKANYALELRGSSVDLAGGRPDFSTALSSGDKRTLALAFFLARVKGDSRLGDKVVVVDDPVSSLDRSRRRTSVLEVLALCAQARQVLVLSHDEFFLHDVEKAYRKSGSPNCATLQLELDAAGYASIESCDLAKVCAGAYEESHRLLSDFIAQVGATESPRSVGMQIRPLLEGYLRRRFPNRFASEAVMLGRMIDEIRDASEQDPLSAAQPQLSELREVAGYAGDFHHDTNPNADSVPVDRRELATYAERALALVHNW